MRLTAAALALALSSTLYVSSCGAQPPAPQGEWPQWRGPNRDGISLETGLLKSWPEGGPKLLWRVEGMGRGYSGVVVSQGRVYTLGDLRTQDGERQFLICVDLATQKRLWTTPLGPAYGDGGPRCTPTVAGGRVYAMGPEGDLLCADARTGAAIWRKHMQRDFGGRMMSGWAYSESPLVDGDVVVVTPGGRDSLLVALNARTGDILWKTPTPAFGSQGSDGAGYSSAVIANAGGVKQYVQLVGRGLVGVNARDGRPLWTYSRMANGTANISTPIVAGDLIFASTAYGAGAALVRISATEAKEVSFLSSSEFQNHHGGMVLVNGYIYGGHGQNAGHPTCIELQSGRVVWKERGPGGGSAAVLFAEGNLYFRYEDGTVALLEASPNGLRVKGQFKTPPMPGPAWAHPAIAGGRLYIRHDDALFCYDIKAP